MDTKSTDSDRTSSTTRRQFFRQASGIAGIAVLLTGCDSISDPDRREEEPNGEVVIDFSDDFGVLNFAYALEQLEAAFYASAIASFYGDLDSLEGQYLRDLGEHENIHRDFLAAAIDELGGTPIPPLEVDFSDVDFSNRNQVLATSSLLEDTGVAAYNGAGMFLSDPTLLTLAGKIVSVEARHAAAIRSLINPDSTDFAGDDVVDPETGLDRADPPSEILAAVGDTGFITTPIRLENVG